jgi:hypothetical protein
VKRTYHHLLLISDPSYSYANSLSHYCTVSSEFSTQQKSAVDYVSSTLLSNRPPPAKQDATSKNNTRILTAPTIVFKLYFKPFYGATRYDLYYSRPQTLVEVTRTKQSILHDVLQCTGRQSLDRYILFSKRLHPLATCPPPQIDNPRKQGNLPSPSS